MLSGPSGAGKDTLVSLLREQGHPFHFVVTTTTRPPRIGEREGVNYNFISVEEFQKRRDRGDFLENAQVYGHWYGIPRAEISEPLKGGIDVLVKVDIQGTLSLKRLTPNAVFIFLAPPSLEKLRTRLQNRRTENPEDVQRRLATAPREMEHTAMFDYVIVNQDGQLEEAALKVKEIVSTERRHLPPRTVLL